jgi:ABC-type dipeptide/oligopeptide/nickel transport system permease subunit
LGAGALIVGAALVCALLGARVAPYDPLRYDPRATLKGPSGAHLLGTDPLGRDVFSQIIAGSRVSMVVGVLSVVAGLAAGTAIGLVAGVAGGRMADLLMRSMDALLVFPSLILALAITAFLGVSLWNVIGALAVTFIPTFAVLVRGEVLSLREREFITAARALGTRGGRIMWRHLLPNLSDVLLVQASFGVGTAILTEASLSFLGLGVPPPVLSWGRMLREGYSYLLLAPWISIASGAAIFLVVLAFQMVSDGLRDILARGSGIRWRARRLLRVGWLGGAGRPAAQPGPMPVGERITGGAREREP